MLVASWGLLRIPVTEKTFKKLGHFMICELFFHCSAAATFCPWIDLNEKNILIESECCIKSIKCQNCFNQKRLSRDRFYECTLVQMFREHLHWRFCLAKTLTFSRTILSKGVSFLWLYLEQKEFFYYFMPLRPRCVWLHQNICGIFVWWRQNSNLQNTFLFCSSPLTF